MAFEDNFDELERLLSEKSTDYEKMREILQKIRHSKEFARMMMPAQDRFYAAIARGHRKVFINLEAGDVEAAKLTTAKVVAWFYVRFQGDDPSMMTRCPHTAEEVRGVRELAARSELLREAISTTTGTELHEP